MPALYCHTVCIYATSYARCLLLMLTYVLTCALTKAELQHHKETREGPNAKSVRPGSLCYSYLLHCLYYHLYYHLLHSLYAKSVRPGPRRTLILAPNPATPNPDTVRSERMFTLYRIRV